LYLTVHGSGSYSVPGGPIWRGPAVYELDPELALRVLDALADFDPGHVEVTEFDPRPPVGVEQGTGTLRPEDLAWNRREPEPVAPEPAAVEDEDDPEAAWEYPCDLCPRRFPSAASLDRHAEFEHPDAHGERMDGLRAAAVEEAREKAERDRLRAFEPDEEAGEQPLPAWLREAAGQ
jgi:hypothetical protein